MNNYSDYIDHFFASLTLTADSGGEHFYKEYLHQSLLEFLAAPSKQTAMSVYTNYCDTYRLSNRSGGKAVLDLLDIMRAYEENAAVLVAKQRDHYVHSVNVFILGLAIYGQNAPFRHCFAQAAASRGPRRFFAADQECFLYCWGLTSLFHDVGYPIEIIAKQMSNYLDAIMAMQGTADQELKAYISFDDFDQFNRLPLFPGGNRAAGGKRPADSAIDLLTENIAARFGLDGNLLKADLDGYLARMQSSGRMDHGFFSALIILKWYAAQAAAETLEPELFYSYVVDGAAAILLHNYYRNILIRPPFSLPAYPPERHPLAYLLFLCDELQDWNREAYGFVDKQANSAQDSLFSVDDQQLRIFYMTAEGMLDEGFITGKQQSLAAVLQLERLFPAGLHLGRRNINVADYYLAQWQQSGEAYPRPLLSQLEAMAKRIHQLYRQGQIDQGQPHNPSLLPWAELSQDLKYSNLRQARSITHKLAAFGYRVAEPEDPAPAVTAFSPAEAEGLSVLEHDLWMRERLESGWQYGPVKDTERRLSPYLVPWEQLSEQIKDLDRDATANIIPLLREVGLKVCRV